MPFFWSKAGRIPALRRSLGLFLGLLTIVVACSSSDDAASQAVPPGSDETTTVAEQSHDEPQPRASSESGTGDESAETAQGRLAEASELERNGLWEQAANLRGDVLIFDSDQLTSPQWVAASLRQARLLLDLDRPAQAERVLTQLKADAISADDTQLWQLLTARSLAAHDDWADAIAAYDAYLEAGGEAASSVRLQSARLWIELNDSPSAIAAYRAVIDDRDASNWEIEAALLEIGILYENRGEYSLAKDAYQRLYDLSPWPNDDAFALTHIGEVLWLNGDSAGATEAWTELVEQYPSNPRAFEGYRNAIARGVEFQPNAEGLLLYRQADLRDARSVFSSHLRSELEPAQEAFARYYLAAIDEDLGDDSSAIVNYLRAASLDPTGSLADDALWWAALLLDQRGYGEIAASYYQRLTEQYPHSDFAARAAVRPGIAAYERGDWALAQQRLQDIIPSAWTSDAKQRAWLWLGKARQAAGDAAGAALAYARARNIDPTGYAGLRAAAAQRDAVYVPLAAGDLARTTADASATADAGAWLEARLGPEPQSDSASPPSSTTLVDDPFWRAAVDLQLAGLTSQARARFAELTAAAAGEPWRLYRLAEQMHQLGLTRQTLEAATAFLAAPGINALDAPARILRWAYPLGWPELVDDHAALAGFDPLLLQALIRQESHFDPNAGSSAGALGLTQVIPPTAGDIAAALADDEFEIELLFRPERSITYGAYYLGVQLVSFAEAPWIALAAYNGGPGNADRWSGGDYGIDPDLFFEHVGYSETREYLRRVLQNYAWYQFIYRDAAAPTLLSLG